VPKITQTTQLTYVGERMAALEDCIAGMSAKVDQIGDDTQKIMAWLCEDEKSGEPGVMKKVNSMYYDWLGAKWFLQNIRSIFVGFLTLLIGFVLYVLKELGRI
jgi:hypothetical protein